MIFPNKPNKNDLKKVINFLDDEQTKTLYRLLIEYDSNAYTSDLREFILKHYKGEK